MTIDINIFSAWMALITALIALGAWITQSRMSNFNTRLEVLLIKEQLYDSEEMINIRCKAAKDILKGDFESNETVTLIDFFEGVGLLLRRGALDKEMVWSDFSGPVLCYWASCEEYIKSVQKEDALLWGNFEYLSREVISYTKKRYRVKSYKVSNGQIKEFLLSESRGNNASQRGRIRKKEL